MSLPILRCIVPDKSPKGNRAARVWLLLAIAAIACGPYSPDRLLDHGGAGMLDAPLARFEDEIRAMNLLETRHTAVPADHDFDAQTIDAGIADLGRALALQHRNQSESARIVGRFAEARGSLKKQVEIRQAWLDSRTPWPSPNTKKPPPFRKNAIVIPAGLPGEFKEYLEGAIAWHAGATNDAVALWQTLLKRPPNERRFRSTWAAFMLGRATWETKPRRAVRYFRQVRELKDDGFADSIGLANASLGWEARVHLRGGDYNKAMDLYLEQAAGGEKSAYLSLRFAASKALRDRRGTRVDLAGHPRARRVVTAHLVSQGWREPPVDVDSVVTEAALNALEKQSWIAAPKTFQHSFKSPAVLWLEAVEESKIEEIESAEKLALLAYRNGRMDLAQRWVRLAADRPTARWLRAKLLLRDGRVNEAAAVLARLTREFPVANETAVPAAESGLSWKRVAFQNLILSNVSARARMLGEMGGLHLARREYVQSLDALLRSGFDADAAYVADRVLTLGELKNYVDRFRPSDEGNAEREAHRYPEPLDVRWLLATRLVRAGRIREAADYFGDDQRRVLEQYATAIAKGRDRSLAPSVQAEVLWDTARIVRREGYGIFRAPIETDWRLSRGLLTMTDLPPARLRPAKPVVLPVSRDEQQRAADTAVFPDRSWYHRFIAADLAWRAAKMMPDNSEETAVVLWKAGSWIQYVDPPRADHLYKELVNRCRNTALGTAADRMRWFPKADASGAPMLVDADDNQGE